MVYYLTPYAARPKKHSSEEIIPHWASSLVISLIVFVLVYLVLNTVADILIKNEYSSVGDVVVTIVDGKEKKTYKLKPWVQWTIFGISLAASISTHVMILKDHKGHKRY